MANFLVFQQFQELRAVISRMLDIDHLVALCSHVNREETPRTAEYKITQSIYLKHTLELVDVLRDLLSKYSNPLFKGLHEVSLEIATLGNLDVIPF